MTLIHRTGDVGECRNVLKSILFTIPALEQTETDPARIEIQGIHLVVG